MELTTTLLIGLGLLTIITIGLAIKCINLIDKVNRYKQLIQKEEIGEEAIDDARIFTNELSKLSNDKLYVILDKHDTKYHNHYGSTKIYHKNILNLIHVEFYKRGFKEFDYKY